MSSRSKYDNNNNMAIEDDYDDMMYYKQKYMELKKKNRDNMERTREDFWDWCMHDEGLDESYAAWLIEQVQFGAIEGGYAQHFEDLKKTTVCFAASINYDTIANAPDGRIQLEPDNQFKEMMKDKNIIVVNVTEPTSGNNGTPSSFHGKAGMKVYDKNGKESIKINPEAKSFVSLSRVAMPPVNGQIGSILNSNNDPIALTENKWTDVDSVLNSLGTQTSPPTKDKKGNLIQTEYVLVHPDHDMYDLVDEDTAELDEKNGYFIVPKKKAIKLAKILTNSVDEALKGPASDLVVFVQPTHDVSVSSKETKSSKRGSVATLFPSEEKRNRSSRSNKSSTEISSLFLANASMRDAIDPSDEKRIEKIKKGIHSVNYAIDVWTIKKKEIKTVEAEAETETEEE